MFFIGFLLIWLPLAWAKCKCAPGDDCWPSLSKWDSLNETIHGGLILNEPFARSCYPPSTTSDTPDTEACNDVTSRFAGPKATWRKQHPIGYMYPLIETCSPITLPNDTSAAAYPPCDLGNYPIYTINATNDNDVAAGVKFAKENNIRLTIKNTGHDIRHRSEGYGSLSIWIRHIRDSMSFQDGFSPAEGSCKTDWTGSAVTISGGYTFVDVYRFASEHGHIIVGGDDPSVGAIGGYIQGGGHGPMAQSFGLAADQALEFTVVLSSGEVVRANECQHRDLYKALKGGGGGTFGIVTSATVKAHPETAMLEHKLVIAGIDSTQTEFFDILGEMISSYPALIDDHWSGYITVAPSAEGNGSTYLHYLAKPLNNTSSDTIARAENIMNENIVNKLIPYNGTQLSVSSTFSSYPSFYKYHSGHTHNQPGGSAIVMSSWFFDRSSLKSSANKVSNLFHKLFDSNDPIEAQTQKIVSIDLIGGGKLAESAPLTSVNPAWRNMTMMLQFVQGLPASTGIQGYKDYMKKKSLETLDALKSFAPNTGTYVNEANIYDPDWKQSWYGGGYEWLESVKQRYDPDSVFWCFRCVGSEAWEEIKGGTLYGPLCEAR